MKMNVLKCVILLALVSVTMACKTKKAVVVTPPVNTGAVNVNKKAENIKLLSNKNIAFNTLSLKGKASLNVNGDVNNVTMYVHIKKDQMIWVSITAIAGIEVARAMITPDSLKLLNKLQSTYTKKPFSYVYGFTNKQVNFKLLQDVLSGNAIHDFLTEQSEINLVNGLWAVNGERENLAYTMLFNTLLKVSETNLNDVKAGQALKVVYDGYQKLGTFLFPSSMKISSMSGIKKINIDLNFSKIESNVPVDFPFNVPKRFKVIN